MEHIDDLSAIPDDKFFLVKGSDLKEVLATLQTIGSKNRNRVFALMYTDVVNLSDRLKKAQEAILEARTVLQKPEEA